MTEKNFDAIGWGIFFVWVGICFLADFSFAVGMLGVGVSTLGMQIARKLSYIKPEGFWVVVGVLFIIGGIWELLKIEIELVPILIIIAGLVILFSVLGGKKGKN